MMRRLSHAVLASITLTATHAMAAPALSPQMQPLGFLVGRWQAVSGRAENGALAKGVLTIEPAAAGAALLRRDRTDLFSADGKPRTSFEQVMLIYPEGGAVHADYFDGDHAIHYVSSTVDPGKSVIFDTAAAPGPRFRLTYAVKSSTRLSIRFEMAPPGAADFKTIAQGDAQRTP